MLKISTYACNIRSLKQTCITTYARDINTCMQYKNLKANIYNNVLEISTYACNIRSLKQTYARDINICMQYRILEANMYNNTCQRY